MAKYDSNGDCKWSTVTLLQECCCKIPHHWMQVKYIVDDNTGIFMYLKYGLELMNLIIAF